jgi:hypothetical protein
MRTTLATRSASAGSEDHLARPAPRPRPGSELGRCRFHEEWLTVYFHSSSAMWLCRAEGFTETVGLVRWNPGARPRLVLDPGEARLSVDEERELIDLATLVWWGAVHGEQPNSKLAVAIHPDWRTGAATDRDPQDLRGPELVPRSLANADNDH